MLKAKVAREVSEIKYDSIREKTISNIEADIIKKSQMGYLSTLTIIPYKDQGELDSILKEVEAAGYKYCLQEKLLYTDDKYAKVIQISW